MHVSQYMQIFALLSEFAFLNMLSSYPLKLQYTKILPLYMVNQNNTKYDHFKKCLDPKHYLQINSPKKCFGDTC